MFSLISVVFSRSALSNSTDPDGRPSFCQKFSACFGLFHPMLKAIQSSDFRRCGHGEIIDIRIDSFVGFVLEVLFARATGNPKRDRKCHLFLPLCPVYGLGAVLILLLPPAVLANPLLLFLCGSLVATAAEYAMAVVYHYAAGVDFWDYSHLPLQLGGTGVPALLRAVGPAGPGTHVPDPALGLGAPPRHPALGHPPRRRAGGRRRRSHLLCAAAGAEH